MSVTWKDRILSALVSGAMAMSLVPTPALADTNNQAGAQEAASVLDSTATTTTPAGPGYKLTLAGLETGDTVTYYRIIEQDVGNNTAIGTQKWKLSEIVDADSNGIVDGTENTDFGHKVKSTDATTVNGLYVDEMVISSYTTDDNGNAVTSDTRQLTPDMVNAIATAVTNNLKNGKSAIGTGSASEDKFEVENAVAGLYMFVAVPKTTDNNNEPDYVYKPVFVAADYYNSVSTPEDSTHEIALETVAGQLKTYADYPEASVSSGQAANAGVFKKSPLSIDKQAGKKNASGTYTDLQSDVAVGDTVDFSITVPVPTYTKNYVAPQFYITDTLTSGLKLVSDSIAIKVMNGNSEVTVTKDTDYKVFVKGDTKYTSFNGMETSPEGFVVQFLNDNPNETGHQDGFLYTVTGAPTATITYQATITSADGAKFAQQINQMDNTAKLIYSRDPNFIPNGYYSSNKTTVTVPDIDPITGEQRKNPTTGDPLTKDVEQYLPADNFNPDDPTNKVTTDPNDTTKTIKEPTGELQDKTRHYTFDIDADVLGRDQSGDKVKDDQGQDTTETLPDSEHDNTSEIRKVWIDANGTAVIQEKRTNEVSKNGDGTHAGSEYGGKNGEYGWLEGAKFSLTQTKSHTVTGAGTGTFEDIATTDQVEIKFDENHVRAATGSNPTSDARGYIAMKGLDAGVYVLKEISAPLGFAFNPNIQYEITITPTYVMEPGTPTTGNTPEDGKGGADDLILSSYEVQIKTQKLDENLNIVGSEPVTTNCTYNLKKDNNGNPISLLKDDGTSNTEPPTAGEPPVTTVAAAGIDTTVQTFGDNKAAMVYNQKLGILPATGGSGILFYLFVGGAVAGIALVLMDRVKKASKMV